MSRLEVDAIEEAVHYDLEKAPWIAMIVSNNAINTPEFRSVSLVNIYPPFI